MFKIGQEVVCVVPKWENYGWETDSGDIANGPVHDEIVTVKENTYWNGQEAIYLVEYPSSEPFNAKWFAPLLSSEQEADLEEALKEHEYAEI